MKPENTSDQKFYSKFDRSKKVDKKAEKKAEIKSANNAIKKSGSRNQNDKKENKKFSKKANPKEARLVEKLEELFSTKNIPSDTQKILEDFDQVIQGVRPLNSKQLQQLPDNIKALSHQLTDQRSERRLGYMNESIQLSSYVRYYTWWNLVRLTRLFSNLPVKLFPSKDCQCLDVGSGPLTVVTALWLARPEMRDLNLSWYCLDVSANSMALGEDIYLSIVAKTGGNPWKIIRVKGPFGTSLKQKADFITCANMFNELDQASDMPPEYQTKKYYSQLQTYATPNASFLLVEPGVPKASRTLSLLRARFISEGKSVIAPCPHAGECPMNGFGAYTGSQNKWCNFAFSTENAPEKLLKLSEKAKLPKERATLSFIALFEKENTDNNSANSDSILCRVASDEFKLPGWKFGHYGCSEAGLVLLKTSTEKAIDSGDLVKASVKTKTPDSLPKDEKSGAVIIEL